MQDDIKPQVKEEDLSQSKTGVNGKILIVRKRKDIDNMFITGNADFLIQLPRNSEVVHCQIVHRFEHENNDKTKPQVPHVDLVVSAIADVYNEAPEVPEMNEEVNFTFYLTTGNDRLKHPMDKFLGTLTTQVKRRDVIKPFVFHIFQRF